MILPALATFSGLATLWRTRIEIIPFAFENMPVRVVGGGGGDGGEPWFVAADVCRILDLSSVTKAVRILDEDERKSYDTFHDRNFQGANINDLGVGSGNNVVTLVSEPGLYKLIGRSRKPEARRFDRWVRHEVLPAIRKTGGYGAAEVAEYVRTLDARGDLFDRAVVMGNRMEKVTNPTAPAVAYYAIGIANASRALQDAFWDGLPSGENLSPGPRLRLREWLLHDDLVARNSQQLTVKRAAVIINAWNSWRRKRKTVDFTWDHTTSLPKVLP